MYWIGGYGTDTVVEGIHHRNPRKIPHLNLPAGVFSHTP